jgi:hypothetical protein
VVLGSASLFQTSRNFRPRAHELSTSFNENPQPGHWLPGDTLWHLPVDSTDCDLHPVSLGCSRAKVGVYFQSLGFHRFRERFSSPRRSQDARFW